MRDRPRQRRDSEAFAALCADVLKLGAAVRFRANGPSMQPNVLDEDAVVVAPVHSGEVKRGDIALTRGDKGFVVHRVVQCAAAGGIITRGDAGQQNDQPADHLLGKVISIERGEQTMRAHGPVVRLAHRVRRFAYRAGQFAMARMRRVSASLVTALCAALFILFAVVTPAQAQATLSVAYNPLPTTPVAAGGTVTYTVVLTNTGLLAVNANVVVTQVVPSNLTFVSAAKSGGNGTWTCNLVTTGTPATSTITCTDTRSYGLGSTTTFSFVETASPAATNGTVIPATVNAVGGNAAQVSASASVTVQTPDLSMSDSGSPNPAATGGTITYTQVVTNIGPAVASGASVTEVTPANTTFASATPPNNWTCGTTPAAGATGTITCSANAGTTIAIAGTATVTVVVNVNPGASIAGSTITNSVTVSESNTDPTPANNTATASITVSAADLALTQSVSPSVAPQGGTITYTEAVQNNGPSAATGAVVYQQTPPNTTFVSATPPAGWTCGTLPASGGTGQIICTDGSDLASGAGSGNFLIVVAVNSGATPTPGTAIVNYADVTSQTADSNVANNTTSTSTLVETTGQADLSLSGTAAPTPVFIDSTLTYTYQLQNLGLSPTVGTIFTDTLPTGVTFVSATSTQGTCSQASGIVTCSIGVVAYPLAAPITITIAVTSPATATTLSSVGSVSSTSPADPVSGNNGATVVTVVQPLLCATPGRDGAGGTLSGVVNAYYPPKNTGTVAAGSASITLGAAAANGAQKAITVGDLLLIIQMQGAQINSTDTTSYGSGNPGNPSGSTNLGSTGVFEFVTAVTNATNGGTTPVTGGLLTFQGTGANGGLLNSYTYAAATSGATGQGIQTFQVIRVPQYTSAVLGSTLTAMGWNGLTGGVLALDVASQLTLGGSSGTVTLDGLGFRGGGGIELTGSTTGSNTDTVTASPAAVPATTGANGSKGEGVAGTPHWIAPATITHTTTATSTAQTVVEGLPNGSFARGAPGNAGGGATDADITANDQNSGGGGGANGGAGGIGGFGWSSAGLVGGYGGASFAASTSSLIMGGGGGAGTTNNGSYWDFSTETGNNNCGASCTGIYSSGASGGAILIIHAGTVVGTGTITSNGLSALAPENDGGGGAGAGGSIRVLANSGSLAGLTVLAAGGTGGNTWPEQAPGTPFPSNRHGPGGGGGGGSIFTSSMPASYSVTGGFPGYTTLADDAYGATPGSAGALFPGVVITQTPGTQSGAYCAGADLAVTNSGSPSIVLPGGNITYTQTVSNSGPFDALNAVFSEAIPANTTFQSIAISGAGAAGWTCTTTGSISCANPDEPSGASGATTFAVVVQVAPGTASGTQIIDTDSVSSGSLDPNLTNNSATVMELVAAAGTADLSVTSSATPNPVAAGGTITYTIVVANNGPASASGVSLSEAIPASPGYATFGSLTCASGWICTTPAAGGTGNISATIGTLAPGATATFSLMLTVKSATPSGTVISETANVNSTTTDSNPENNSATSNVTVATAGQYDLSVTKTASPNPVLPAANITFVYQLGNNGPASATNVTLVDAVPANTTFVSANIPIGWICPTLPAAGGTGAISCCPGAGTTCSGAAVASGSVVNFSVIEKVNASTAPGTVISNTASVAPTANDVNTANNTATASTVVASPSQADVSIVKTAAPEPVDQGTNLTYTLRVTNNGPAVAQNVNVSDPLPTQVTYTSVSTTAGTCTQSGGASGTVSCSLGSLSVGSVATIAINVSAATFSSSTLATNTATVSSTTGDPNAANNSSTAVSTIETPTAVQLSDFHASTWPSGGVLIEWHTKEEVRNLGFHLYREDAQGRHRLDPSLIAGAALVLRGGLPQHGAKTYQWPDPDGDGQSAYWIEDVDLNGTRTMHGPVYAQSAAAAGARIVRAPLLAQMNRFAAAAQSAVPAQSPAQSPAQAMPSSLIPGAVRRAHPPTWRGTATLQTPAQISSSALNGVPAIKLSISSEGWYQVTGAQLYAAGLNPRSEARTLQLFAEGVEQPMLINGSSTSPFGSVTSFGPLGANDTIQFYGTAIDTPFSGTRVYWLVSGSRAGQRIATAASPYSGSATGPASFPFTVFLQQRTTYFAALLNGENNDNFFGAVVSSDPVDQPLEVLHSDPSSAIPTTLDVTLQGATDGQAHSVSVFFNGASVGEMDFNNQANTTATFSIPGGLLHDGSNTVTLTALQGDNDVSLVQSIALHYAHTYTADSDWLEATATGGMPVRVTGFANAAVQAFDITNPLAIAKLAGRVAFDNNGYGITLVPQGNGSSARTLLIFAADQIAAPDALTYHAPNTLGEPQYGAPYLVIAHPDYAAAAAPLAAQHQSEGLRSMVVTTDQIYDAFNYGEHSPFAVQQFLQFASTRWSAKPQSVLLLGDASLDPRNYLGFGDLDFVPTRMIQTDAFKTASDDWLTDFKQTGFATIPTGRIPADTVDEATLAITRIVDYERGATAGSWQQQATVIADQNVGNDFSAAALAAGALLPSSLTVQKILTDGEDPVVAQQQILAAINGGTLLVNYSGHGAEDQWSFADIFDDTTAAALSNGDRLPVFVLMDCLNGFFQDVYTTSLAESLLFAPNGGAVAVWASSGFTDAPPQATMNQAFLTALAANPNTSLGQAILQAKLGITDQDVRRTWVLFGDPAMRLPLPATPKPATRRSGRQ